MILILYKDVKKLKKKIIGIGIIVIIAAGAGIYINSVNKGVEVHTSAVLKGDIAEYVEDLGTVKVKNHENIYSPIGGKVSEVFADIGDEVKAGDVLIRLDGEQLSRQIAELDAQRSAILAQYNEAKKPLDNKNIEKLKLDISQIEKRIKTAKETVNDKKTLFEAGAISNEEYQFAVRNLEYENSNLEKAKLDLELLSKPVSENILAQYEAQLKQLDIKRKDLVDTGEDFTITASMDGKVLQKSIEKGSYLQPGMFIMEIGNVDELYVESDILVGDIVDVTEGCEVRISSKDIGLSDLEGVVKKIYPSAFSKVSDLGVEQKRVKVDIEMKDSAVELRPGYVIDIKIITNSKKDVLLIPENAVFKMDERQFVFVNENNKAVLREIKTGIKSHRQIEVNSGLNEGEIVILSPDEKIEEGVRIKGKSE